MKKLFMIGLIIFSVMTVATVAKAQAEFKFELESFDFGKIKEGPAVTHQFKFKNVGNKPLTITDVKASCGCTTPSWPKEAIAPGKDASITVQYNTENRPNAFNKSITITSNAKTPTKILYIKGEVEPKASKPDGK